MCAVRRNFKTERKGEKKTNDNNNNKRVESNMYNDFITRSLAHTHTHTICRQDGRKCMGNEREM